MGADTGAGAGTGAGSGGEDERRHQEPRGTPHGPGSTPPEPGGPPPEPDATPPGPGGAARAAGGGVHELSGSVRGHAVQAGTVHGGIHIRTGPAAGPGGAEQHVPWQLPPRASLIDRVAEVAALERRRAQASREGRGVLAAVSGLGGVGKTAVALEWLHTLRTHFPGGQLHADLGAQSPTGPADPAEVLSRFLRALGVPVRQVPVSVEERAALYRSMTAERELVVLLDDAATAAQARLLLPAGPNVTVVTSRWRLPGLTVDGCYPMHLEPLGPDAAVELLAVTLDDDRVATQERDARTLVDLCAGLPLAVRVAGARLAARPGRRITTMVRALAQERDRLGALAIEGDHDVRAALDLSYQGLPGPAARLYRLLGLHPGAGFGFGVASAVLGGPDGPPRRTEVQAALDALHDANLLNEQPPQGQGEPEAGPESDGAQERYRFHDLVRLHAASRAEEDEPAAERARAQRRIFDFYLATATEAERRIEPQHRTLARDYGPDPVAVDGLGDGAEGALGWLERELPGLMGVLVSAREAGVPTVAWQLADAMWPLFLRRKHYERWRLAHAEGLAAARDLGDAVAECRMLTSGGMGELSRGEHGRALEMFEQAAALFRETGDALGLARTLNYRGLAHQRAGRDDEAAAFFAQAATELPACGDVRAGALARLNLAEAALAAGRAGAAYGEADAARTTLGAEGDPYNAARAAVVQGRASLVLDRPDEAGSRLTEALEVLRAAAADRETARALAALAVLAERRGRPERAAALCREALELHRSAGGPDGPEIAELRALLARLEALEAP